MTISVGHGKGKASQLQISPSSHVFCFTGYKLRKTDPENSNYLRYRRGNVFPDCHCFCPPFWKKDAADNLSRTRNVHDFWQWGSPVSVLTFSSPCFAFCSSLFSSHIYLKFVNFFPMDLTKMYSKYIFSCGLTYKFAKSLSILLTLLF